MISFMPRTGECKRLVQSPVMVTLISLLKQLEQERNRLASQLERLNSALSALNVKGLSRNRGISTAGRAKIAAAQRARWAKARGEKVVPITSRRKRKMPAAAISKIRAAQKARWAKWRKEQKTA